MTKNYAHRGYCVRYPENTMLAFRKAVETGCDGIELDVHLTSDSEVVIIHDEELDRTTNGKGFVKDRTLAELKSLDAGRGQRIPSLDEYLDLVEKLPVITNIELKTNIFWYKGIEEKLIEKIRTRLLTGQVIFSSFNHYSILKCKKLAPEIRCGFLTGEWIVDAGAYTKKSNVECYHPEFNSLTKETVAEIHSQGIEVNAYTVNKKADMEKLLNLGVDGIITNDPALFREVMGR
jgi:glycerophosphoryl diester phosphodiesterase